MALRGGDHRFRAGLAVLLQQVFFERSGINADADGAIVVFRGLDDFLHPLVRADVAGIDAQAGSAGGRRFNSAFVMEVDVGHHRRGDLPDDFFQRFGRVFIRAGHTDDIRTRLFHRVDLRHGCRHIRRQRISHRLHGNRRIAAHGHACRP